MLLLLQQNLLLGEAADLVEVPDVVGQEQAAGTTTLEGEGFVVAVETAYSSTVAAGTIISQSPTAGSEALSGSTVTITVSLGDQPQQQGGGGFWFGYDRFAAERRRRKREEQEREEEAQQIQDELDRQIAIEQRALEAEAADKADLQRIQKLADEYSGKKLGLPKKVSDALISAYERRSRNALEQLLREIDRAQEEEEMALIISMLLID